MKRFLIVPSLLAMALVQTNCAETEVGAIYDKPDNLEVITVQTATAKNLTRGCDANTASLEAMNGEEYGVGDDATATKTLDVLVVSEKETPVATNQTLSFKYTEDGWVQDDTDPADYVIWSAIDYPSRFYSLFSATVMGMGDTAGYCDGGVSIALTQTDGKVDPVSFTQSSIETGNSYSHEDVVFATVRVAATPLGGAASMIYSHVLSKIDILVSTENQDQSIKNEVNIQSVKLANVNSTADFQPDFYQTEENGTETTGRSTSIWSTPTNPVTYGYCLTYESLGDLNVKNQITGAKEPIVTPQKGYSMMVIPQLLKGAAITEKKIATADLATTSYIEVIYQGVTKEGGSFAGEAAAGDAWNYIEEAENLYTTTDAYWNAATKKFYAEDTFTTEITDQTDGAFQYPATTDPLFIKVAFPFAAYDDVESTGGNELADGKYYNFILGMGGLDSSTGGYLMEENYYDSEGHKLPLVVNDEVLEPGDPILPDANGAISIVVKVTEWDDATEIEKQ